ncbi:Gfo/Idh/MocA family protein [Halalkalicoccus sp. NIPERK01]|uniref:Gfo/Idh/MocA family protein n=1 Tax=Halalkalicoccus sp. NIPERK01 TaxID=3053469 RepID=UPI00256EA9E3|nr:Gfo/Idh/MocA family oxidoreductase [Halalkalicoccus sp. NIPERK01]MDL5363263.1 Gfo/Idh/MocA family oxidoreductase [Halalkalicoccus sp. NIPERK01]
MTLDVGFLGYRFMGKAHANALARLPMFFPDAPAVNRKVLVGRDEAAVADAADRFGFDRTTDDWSEAIDEVDVFYNLGPTHVHAEPTIEALEAGVHVMCEKPLATDLETARRMREAARDSDAIAGVGFNYRYVPALQLAKRLIDEGLFGEIYRVRGRCLQDWLGDLEDPWNWRTDEERAGTGVLGDVGSHTIDLARWLIGDVERVSGQLTIQIPERPAPDGDGTREVTTDDEYSAIAEFDSGAVGVFEGSRVATGRKADNSIEVYGSEGGFKFSLRRLNELRVLGPNDRGFQGILVTDPNDPYIDAWWPPGHIVGWEHTFVHENYEFLTSVADGTRYRPDFEDGFEVQRVLDAVQTSNETGRRTRI